MDQAGLGGTALPSGAGLGEPPLTMEDQGTAIRRLMAQGMSAEDAYSTLGVTVSAPPPPPLELQPPAPAADTSMSRLGMLPGALRQTAGDWVEGAGMGLAGLTGIDSLETGGRAVGDFISSDESDLSYEAAVNERAANREALADPGPMGQIGRFAGDLGDVVTQSAPALAGAVAGAKGGESAARLAYLALPDRAKSAAMEGVAEAALKALPSGRRFAKMNPAAVKRFVLAGGAALGGLAFSVPSYLKQGTDRAASEELDLNDPKVQSDIKEQALVRGVLEVFTPLSLLGKMGKPAEKVMSKFRAMAKEGFKDGLMEGAQELSDNALEELYLNPELIARLDDKDKSDLLPWMMDTMGRKAALSLFAGAALGGPAGATTGLAHQGATNKKMAMEVKTAARVLEPLGLGTPELEELSKTPEGTAKLRSAVERLGRVERSRSAQMREIDANGGDDETVAMLREQVNNQLDEKVDAVARTLGAPKTVDEVRKERSAWEKQRRTAAAERLRAIGMKPGEAVSADVAEAAATRVEQADGRVTQLRDRLEATANPERRAQTQTDLDEALAEQQQARLDGRMKVEGLTSAQALKATQQDLKQTEVDRRRATQTASRERAVARQTEIEMPETMAPAARVQRAQEIIAEAQAEVRPDAGIDGRVKRLERQRRAATSPEDVDKLTNEIADLEARRGLPTPAVEAARRVLQAQGVAVPQSGEATRPAAQPAGSEGLQPTDAASGPVGAAAPAGPRNALDVPVLGRTESAALRKAGTPEVETALFDKALADRRVTDTADVKRASETYRAERATGRDPVAAAETALGTVVASDREAGRAAMAAKVYKRVPATDGFDVEGGNPYRELSSEIETAKGLDALEASMTEWSQASGFEVGAHVNEATGEVLGVGTNDMINAIMPPKEGLNDRAITFTHTHTENTPFSSADVRAALVSGQKFRAVLPDGSIIVMQPLRRYNPDGFFKVFRAVREHLITTLPADMPFIERAVIRQEAFLQAMEVAGAIEYQTSFRGLSDKQKDYVNAAVDAVSGTAATAFVRDGASGRAGAQEAGQPGGQVGERRAFDEAAGETFGDDFDEEGFDLEQAVLGFDDGRSSDRDKRPSFNEERVGELTDKIIADVMAPQGRRTTGAKMILEGEITRDQVLAGVGEYLKGDGRKQMYTVIDVRRAMFPNKPITFDMIEQFMDNRTGRLKKPGSKIWRIRPEYHPEFQVALDLERMINEAGMGAIQRRENRYPLKNEKLDGKTYFLDISPDLRKFTSLIGPEGMRFDPPLDDPNDTTKIKRNPKSNRLSPEGLDVARRTARYLQANRYKIDKVKLYAIQPDALVSGKSLARDGIRQEHITRWDALEPTLPPKYWDVWKDWDKELKYFIRNYGWKINEKRREAKGRIRQLHLAYETFVAQHGEDGDVGFLYQIDDRGRIYADGSFHPQADGDIKALFSVDGKNIVDDMVTVDNSASGWQINALMAYDHVAAPRLNMGRGQATEPGYKKSDLYNNTLETMRTRLLVDAEAAIPEGLNPKDRKKAEMRKAWARMFSDLIFPSSDPKGWLLDRKGIKPAIIAMNYGGLEKNFLQVMTRTLSKDVNRRLDLQAAATGQPKMDMNGAWSYLTEVGMSGVRETAPHALALQEWTLKHVAALSRALYAKYGADAPAIELTIGVDGKIVVDRKKRVDTETRIKQVSKGVESTNTVHIKVSRPEPDHEKVAKAVWANLVQSYDAAVLHRAVERYKVATKGAYLTTNHDSFTVPREQEGAISSAVRESMRTIMEQVDVPKYLYEEMTNMARVHGVELGMEPFDNRGRYNYDDLMSSTPVFGEDVTRLDERGKPEDFVPAYGELPEAGADLRRAVDPEVPEAGVGAAASETPPVRAAVRGQGVSTIAELPPELRRAVDVADYMASLPETSSLLAKVQELAHTPAATNRTLMNVLEDTMFNSFAPIRRLEISLKGKLPEGAESAFKASEMAVQDSGRQEALLYYGAAAVGQYGEYAVAPGTMGLHDIWRLAGGEGADRGQQLQDWMQWMVARRVPDLAKRGIKTPLTQADIQKAMAKAANNPTFQQAADAWKKFNDANLDFLEKSGIINAAQKKAMQEDDFYVPFYRSDERVDGTSPELVLPEYRGGTIGTGVLKRDPGIRKMVGGDKMRIDNLMQNMMRNSQAMVAAGMRNMAANKTFDLMEQAGMARVEPISAKKPDKNAVRMWKNGVESWVIPQGADAYPVMIALAGMQPVQMNRVMQIMADIASIFRQGITLTPPFMIRNVIRGAVSSGIMTSGANLTLTNNTVTGFREAFNNGNAAQAFKAQSGMGDYRFGQSDVGFGKNDILMEFGLVPKTMGMRFRSFMEKMEHVGSATELADRLAARETMIKNGMRPDEASYQALTIMNYSRKGSSQALRAWLPLVPFFNARLQGLSRLAEGAVGKRGALGRKQALMQIGLNGLIYSLISGAIWAWNASDDDRWEKYQDEPLYRRLNYHIIYVGGTTLYIPKAFELGSIFSSIPELFADAFVKQDGGEVTPGLVKIAKDTVLMNLIPAAVMPSIEAMTNYDFFRQASLEGQREESLLPADRTQGASNLSRLIGRDMGVSGLTGVSPTMIEHWMSSHGGIYYTMLSSAFDIVAGDMGLAPVRPGGAFGDTPIISPALNAAFGSMVKDSAITTTKWLEEFYNTKDYVTQIYRSATAAARGGDMEYANRLLAQAGGTPAAYKLLNKATTDLSDISTALRMLRDDRTMTREQKRKKETELIQMRNARTKGVMGVIRGIEEKQGATFRSVQ